MPDFLFSSEDEVPVELRGGLVKDEASGKFKINLVPNTKLKEFRDSNIELAKERDALKSFQETLAPVVGEDPQKFQQELSELKKLQQQVKDGTVKTTDAIQKEVDARVASLEKNYKDQLAELGTKLARANDFGNEMSNRFRSSVRDREITNAILAPESGVNPQALPDILSRASGIFQVSDDGSLIPKKGDTVLYGADGATPMSPKEWLATLLEEAPYLGRSSAGGGAAGGKDDGKIGGMSAKDFAALSPARRMQLHREQQKKRA